MSPAGERCPACSRPAARPWGEKAGYPLLLCSACGSIEARVPPGDELGSAVYDRLYSGAAPEIPDTVRQILRDLVASFEPYRRTNRFCDLGFGAGTLLEVAAEKGWDCHGTETSEVALREGRSRGWKVSRPFDRDASAWSDFDVVTGIEFLEHVADGRREIADTARSLRTGGVLYLTTPNARSLNRRLLGAGWSIIAPPDHRLLWSPAGMSAALRAAGLRPTRLRTTGLNPSELKPRTRRARAGRQSSRVETAYELNTWVSRSPWRRALKRSVNRILSLFALGDTLKVWAIRQETTA